MKPEFYLIENIETELSSNSYDLYDGHIKVEEGVYGCPTPYIINNFRPIDESYIPVFAAVPGYIYHSIQAVMFDSDNNYLGYKIYQYGPWTELGKTVLPIIPNTKKIYFNVAITGEFENISRKWIKVGYPVVPHYSKISKKYQKENDQIFFRESLDGKITLFGMYYDFVKNASLESTLGFEVYKGGIIYASSSFNKSDCKFNYFNKSVELKLSYNDYYTKILDAYENSYDLIKLMPAITPLTVTKRSIVQIYIQGENVVSNYSGGTYWETEVNEVIDDPTLLTRKYFFSKGPKFIEVSLSGFNYNINAAYTGLWDSDCWNATSIRIIDGVKYKMPCSIKFTKVAVAGQMVVNPSFSVHYLSTGTGNALEQDLEHSDQYTYIYDTYRIEIYTGRDGTGDKIYQSKDLYGKNAAFTLSSGLNLYQMEKVAQPTPMLDPSPASFYLGENVIEYQIWGRLLCDVEESSDGVVMMDLPYDDFATARRNYKKCIGLVGFDSDSSVVKIYQNQNTSETPTAYGINDFNEYFVPPYSLWGQYFYPLARSSWGNTSLWVMLDETIPTLGFEAWSSKHYKEYVLKNSYHIADVIKALLQKIEPTVTHDKTAEYSQFLYAHNNVATAYALGDCDIYITQKTNILKGEYDQAAQKAEIQFKQIMDMLRDCFRCYWFIDEYNRLRIEHVSYFMNGMNYASQDIFLDLTHKYDKFNKKRILYSQQQLEFDKTDLAARYEFEWMDDVTDSMGNLRVDVNNKYVQKDKTDDINVNTFVPDIDYMLFLPDDFSNDGFALLMAHNGKVPIVHQELVDEKQPNRVYDVYTQNWFASFNQLIQHYMKDMPGAEISTNNLPSLRLHVDDIKKCLVHNIEFSAYDITERELGHRLIKTELGNGYVEEVSINIDTDLANIELRYAPL